MAQVKLVLVAAALLALLAVALAVPAKYRRDDGHAASDSSSSDSSDSSDSSSSESREDHDRRQQPQQPARNVPVSADQHEDQQQEEQYAGRPLDNAIPFEEKDSDDVLPPFPKPVRRNEVDVIEQKMEPGQPWESHYKHGVAPAKLPAQETDNAHSYRHSIIHPYGDDLHA